jgi:hypothetical protein
MRLSPFMLAVSLTLACGGPARIGTGASGIGAGASGSESRPGRAIIGKVIDKTTGQPVGFANVRANQGYDASKSDMSNADGSFRLELEPGTYTVIASAGARQALYNGIVVFPDKTTTLNFELSVPTERNDAEVSGSIEGTVIDKVSREPFPGAVISAASPVLADAQMAMAGDDGVYRFEQLPPGTYVVSVYYHLVDKGNIEVRRSGIVVTRGSSKRVDLEIDTRLKR